LAIEDFDELTANSSVATGHDEYFCPVRRGRFFFSVNEGGGQAGTPLRPRI
jgi:hypothetical protein